MNSFKTVLALGFIFIMIIAFSTGKGLAIFARHKILVLSVAGALFIVFFTIYSAIKSPKKR